jgi:hypothetical protein
MAHQLILVKSFVRHCTSLTFSSDTPFVRLYHVNSLELLDAIFADQPYFLPAGP